MAQDRGDKSAVAITLPELSPRRERQISILLTIIALGLWSHSIIFTKFEVGRLGLVSSLPITFFIALGFLTLSSAILWVSKERHDALLALELVIFISALWLIPLVAGGSPTFLNHSYRNLGFIDFISRYGDFGSIWYLNWPGAFIVPAMLLEVGGINFEPLLIVTPLFLNLLYLLPLGLFLRNTLGSSNYVFAGCFLFSLAQWTGQDYFSSAQGVGFFLFLLMLALITTPPIWQKGFNAISLRLLAVIVFASLVVTHLLTSLAALCLLGAFSLVKLDKRMALLLIISLALLMAWNLTETRSFTQSRLPLTGEVSLVQEVPKEVPKEEMPKEEAPPEEKVPTKEERVKAKGRPIVRTWEADKITEHSARLRGKLLSLGDSSLVYVSYEWGPTPEYGNETTAQSLDAPATFPITITDLSPGTTYHYRAKAVGKGVSYGEDRSFTTAGTPPPPVEEKPPEKTKRGLLILDPEVIVEREITGHISGSASHAEVAIFRIAFSSIFLLFGLSGFIYALLGRRKLREALTILLLTLAPLVLVTLTGHYGREIAVRLYLFALPGMAYFGATLFALRRRVVVLAFVLLLLAGIPLHVIAHYGNQELDYVSPAQLVGLKFFHEKVESGITLGAWNLGTLENIERYIWARVPLHSLEWEDDRMVSCPASKGRHCYLGISRQNKARYEWFSGNTEVIDKIEERLKTTVNYNLFYQSPDLKLYISETEE